MKDSKAIEKKLDRIIVLLEVLVSQPQSPPEEKPHPLARVVGLDTNALARAAREPPMK